MSSLALSVLLLVAIAIGGVVGYNLWLMRRLGAGRVPETVRREPAPGGPRGEPSLGLAPSDPAQPDAPTSAEPAFPSGSRDVATRLDPRTDGIIELTLPSPLAAERLLVFGHRLRRVGSKPVTLEALEEAGPFPEDDPPFALDEPDETAAVDAEPAGIWSAPVPGRHYRRARFGVLLANRSGPLNAMEFSEFVAGVQAIAEPLGAFLEPPDMTAVLARARALDELCASLDAQVDLSVEAGEALGVQELSLLAIEADCVERGNNRYVRLGDQGEVLFSLALADAPDRLSLLLDVPRVPASPFAWIEMLTCARVCAERVGGRLVDDAGRPLGDEHLNAIAQQITQRHQALEAAGFPAGSASSLRLFN